MSVKFEPNTARISVVGLGHVSLRLAIEFGKQLSTIGFLVGGHCIGAHPNYPTHKAQAIGYHPDIILAGQQT